MTVDLSVHPLDVVLRACHAFTATCTRAASSTTNCPGPAPRAETADHARAQRRKTGDVAISAKTIGEPVFKVMPKTIGK
ncbi:MAG: hypothetical protein ACXW31_07785 [Thermoanaerobaculia bacterium]